jgi:hypothetical protein
MSGEDMQAMVRLGAAYLGTEGDEEGDLVWYEKPEPRYCGYRYDGSYGVVPVGTPGAKRVVD